MHAASTRKVTHTCSTALLHTLSHDTNLHCPLCSVTEMHQCIMCVRICVHAACMYLSIMHHRMMLWD